MILLQVQLANDPLRAGRLAPWRRRRGGLACMQRLPLGDLGKYHWPPRSASQRRSAIRPAPARPWAMRSHSVRHRKASSARARQAVESDRRRRGASQASAQGPARTKQVPVSIPCHPLSAGEMALEGPPRAIGSRSGSMCSTIRATSRQSAPSTSASGRRMLFVVGGKCGLGGRQIGYVRIEGWHGRSYV